MRFIRFTIFLAMVITFAKTLPAETTLPKIIGSNMVLQRGKPIPIWGWESQSQTNKVTVTFNGKSVTTTPAADGKWSLKLPIMKAGGPFEMSIEGSTQIKLKNIMVGEVWLCSGQSNMEWTVRSSNNAKKEIAEGQFPGIRHIKIPHRPSDKPESDVPSKGWEVCSDQTVANFTAVGYFFGKKLHQELNVPIGLIGSNWGGTRIEPWTPPEGFRMVPALKASITDKLDQLPVTREVKNKEGKVTGKSVVHQSPLALYNGMIHPLLPYSIRGAIWYQGESNNGEGMMYYEKMKALILGWRAVWKTPDLPFYFVQLAPFNYGAARAGALPLIWEAQSKALDLPYTGMAVTTDISNVRDIHPRNKQDVGLRLALWALAKDYGKPETVFSGPKYKSMTSNGNKITIRFDHVGGGLISRDGKDLSHFTIAGSDKKFVPAKAKIVAGTIVISANGIDAPLAVRFGWDQTAEPNLANREGLPASPFRTDKW